MYVKCVPAQKLGRTQWYEAYEVQIAEMRHEYGFLKTL